MFPSASPPLRFARGRKFRCKRSGPLPVLPADSRAVRAARRAFRTSRHPRNRADSASQMSLIRRRLPIFSSDHITPFSSPHLLGYTYNGVRIQIVCANLSRFSPEHNQSNGRNRENCHAGNHCFRIPTRFLLVGSGFLYGFNRCIRHRTFKPNSTPRLASKSKKIRPVRRHKQDGKTDRVSGDCLHSAVLTRGQMQSDR